MSALRIVAAAYRDGWAFVREDERFLLVRPPYQGPRLVEVSPEVVDRAVHRHGFEVQDKEVADWRALIDFLRERRMAMAAAEGQVSLPDEERMSRLLRAAPRSILERYLDRVEKELIPQAELDAALRVLAAMGHPDIPSMDAALQERVAELVAACSKAIGDQRDKEDDLLGDDAEMARRFPRVKKKHGEAALRYARRVQEARQIFAVGS